MSKYIIGLDLGQTMDHTALGVLEVLGRTSDEKVYHLRHLERFKLGTPYTSVVDRVARLMNTEPLNTENTDLIVDGTGVGRPVIDLLEDARLYPVGVTITGGSDVSGDDIEGYRVPKRDLVSNLQVLFQSGRLKVAEKLPLSKTLVEELLNFKVKITVKAHDTYEVWREGIHDDLVLAVALGCWYGQQDNDTEINFRWIA